MNDLRPAASGSRRVLRAALSTLVLLAAPAAFLIAGRLQPVDTPEGQSPLETALLEQEGRRAARLLPPEATSPPAEFAPFGHPIARRILQGEAARGMLLTNLGHVDWDPDRDDLAATVPPDWRLGRNDAPRGPRGTLRAGLNFVLLDEAAVAARGLDDVMAALTQHGRIVGVLPGSTLLMYVEPRGLEGLRHDPAVARTRAMEDFQKVDPLLGVLPRISRHEAANPDLLATVAIVPGLDGPELRRRIEAIPGVTEVEPYLFEGNAYQLRVNYKAVRDLARLEEVVALAPVPDYMLFNAENVPTVQAGSAEDANFARPFDLAGVDGGGIDTNGDGRRINDGTDAVPPQIVTIVDNGISLDTPSFAQTLAQTVPLTTPIGPQHRKIHSIQVVGPSGDGVTCDSPLSGGSTHGNVVASVIAAYPSYLGVYATRPGIVGTTAPSNANLDGVARGARIIMEDAAGLAQCTINTVVERGGNISPGPLLNRMNLAICPSTGGVGFCSGITGGGMETHLAVMPFGTPVNFSDRPPEVLLGGTYPQAAVDVDTFLYNNRDFMIFAPVGNDGALVNANRLALMTRVIPDLFNGTDLDEDPNADAAPIQVPPPATAKNIISVGGSTSDFFTFFGSADGESTINAYSSRGPATPESLRMAPIITAPQFDFLGIRNLYPGGVAVFRSTDNDNLPPIEAQLDEGNFGTSFAAAYMTGAGAIIRDYFAQGFYPSGDRVTGDRVANVSGALVKAALAASADFNEGGIGTQGQELNERNLRRTRCLNLGTVTGIGGSVNVGVMCNSEQGYGRPVLTQVLPLSNWSDDFVLHPVFPNVHEYPAAGLLVFDRIATGEALINNTTTSVTHDFNVIGSHTIAKATSTPVGAVALTTSILRIAASWPDLPSPAGTGGPLINDLDLTVESPGPDNCLVAGETNPVTGLPCAAGAATDNIIYDGNNYDGGTNNALLNQWSRGRLSTAPVVHETRNPVEAVHLTGNPNNDGNYELSPLYIGHWRATVKRGVGGAVPGSITIPTLTTGQDADQNEDDNGNGRLDPGEDNNGNGLLDQPGQPFSLVISGPVFLAEAAPPAGPTNYPLSSLTFDQSRYSCSSSAVLSILDTTGSGTPAISKADTSFQVLNAAGAVVDTESGINFVTGSSRQTVSAGIPVRLGAPPITGNGILEGDTGFSISATYARDGQRAMTAKAGLACSPDLVGASFLNPYGGPPGDQVAISGGCDDDPFPDAGETVTYGVAFLNRSRGDDYAGVTATLTPSGPGAAAVRVLDSPRDLGRLPAGASNSVFFHLYVNPAQVNALSVANRTVDMTLTLDSSERGARIARQSYTFHQALNSDREVFYYSTDRPAGGREVRDLNRDGLIDPPDAIDPMLGFVVPREDVTFSSLWSGSGAPPGHVTNEMGEDLNLNGVLDGAERDILPNGVLDRGIVASNLPSPGDKVPWAFDANNGGFNAFRHPDSIPSANVSPNPVWERVTGGVCGFQTSGGAGLAGIWHTGDGDPATPAAGAPYCENYPQPFDDQTNPKIEILFDVLTSPLIAKVNQAADARGFPWTVEFQRFGMNLNIQTPDGYAGGGVNIDNDADNDSGNSLLAGHSDVYYARRLGGWPYGTFRFSGQYFDTGRGIYPGSFPPQHTFGPFTNPNNSPTLDGDETGFTGFTANTNPNSTSPIPEAPPDFLPYPLPGAPVVGVCDGGTKAKGPCDPGATGDPCIVGGGLCTPQLNKVAGPVRNFDASLIGFEGGFASMLSAIPVENALFTLPGSAGNRWLIGIGFWALESTSHATDYGAGIDDVVFEWREYHPRNELRCVGGATPGADCATNADCGAGTCTGGTPACSRFGGTGQPAGGQCASIAVDRTQIYECDGTIGVTVFDAKCVAIGPGATTTLGGACTTNAACGTGGDCTAAHLSVEVAVVTGSDGVPTSNGVWQVTAPGAKRFTLAAVSGTPGLFRGIVPLSTVANDTNHLFITPTKDHAFTVYYPDPLCDGDRDGVAGEDDFADLDGDGVANASDKCPFVYNPGQVDTDADGVDDLCDNCPVDANSDQADADADGVGDVCEVDDVDGDGVLNLYDSCPDILNNGVVGPHGKDIRCDNNGTGGVCTAGFCSAPVWNAALNFGPGPVKTARPCVVNSDCNLIDRDYDAVPDYLDNCVDTYNPTQLNVDGDNLGDACDDDCAGRTHLIICRPNPFNTDCSNSCASAPGVCGAGGTCVSPVPSAGKPCTVNADCTYATPNTVGTSVGGANCVPYVRNSGTCAGGPNAGAACSDDFACGYPAGTCARNCAAENDDFDVDGVADAIDNCPLISNPPVVAGTAAQADADRDGLGDACDPTGSSDDGQDGIPDDIATFSGAIACDRLPLASFAILSVNYLDLDGDHDVFPDTGETGRVTVTLRNNGAALTGAVFTLTSTDPNVACITQPTVTIASVPAGGTFTIGSLDPGQPGFTFTASNALQWPPPPAPPTTIALALSVVANEALGSSASAGFGSLPFILIADANTPPGSSHVFTVGADGLAGTADDGTVAESFDIDRDGDGDTTVRDTFLNATAPGVFRGSCSNAALTTCQTAADCPPDPPDRVCYSGAYLRGSATGTELNRVAGIACGGFDIPPGNPSCILNPSFPMDWHLHCAPGSTHCPNVESGTCVGGCSFNTPADGQLALSPPNSLHMGAHKDPQSHLVGDTTHIRTIQGFMSAPFNLAFFPRPGDLELSFFQIARLMDNNSFNEVAHICVDCGDVQIQVDHDPDPNVDSWGFWDKLVPYQNVYDHKAIAWSTFGPYYCEFTPGDTGSAPPNPRGVHETLCFDSGAWSRCGSTTGTLSTATGDCAGPGTVDPSGTGVWVQTRFHLNEYLGQRVRIRWVGSTWNFGPGYDTYFDVGPGWSNSQSDDGWWLDNIAITGALQHQFSPTPDTTPRTGTCPSDPCDATVGDAGTSAALEVTDLSGRPVDGASFVPVAGQVLRLSAAASTLPGGCTGGIIEYQFLKGGVVLQEFSPKAFIVDSPDSTTHYQARVRCGADHGCTSVTGAARDVGVYTGEGGDVALGAWGSPFNPGLGVVYDRAAATTTLRFWTPAAAGAMADVYRGLIGPGITKGSLAAGSRWLLDTSGAPGSEAACLQSNVVTTPETPPPTGPGGGRGTIGPLNQAADANPAPGTAVYYLVAGAAVGSAPDGLGCANPALCSRVGWCEGGSIAGAPCDVNVDCFVGGTCTPRKTVCATDAGAAELGGCGRHPVCASGSRAGLLCTVNTDCASSGVTCLVVASSVTSPGSICLTVNGALGATPAGAIVTGCPPTGTAPRIIRKASAAGVCP